MLFDKYNILNFPCGFTGAQMGGWFRGEVKTVDDLRGLKVKAGGFARQVLARMGAAPVDLPIADTYAALEQGGVDAVAWIGPHDDESLALYKVARNYYFPGWWAGTLQLSLYVNQDAHDELPKSYQAALELASRMATSNMIAKYDAGNPDALRRLVQRGAQLKAFPRPMLQAAHEAALKLYQELSGKDPMFKEAVRKHDRLSRQGNPLVPRGRGQLRFAHGHAGPAGRLNAPGRAGAPGPESVPLY